MATRWNFSILLLVTSTARAESKRMQPSEQGARFAALRTLCADKTCMTILAGAKAARQEKRFFGTSQLIGVGRYYGPMACSATSTKAWTRRVSSGQRGSRREASQEALHYWNIILAVRFLRSSSLLATSPNALPTSARDMVAVTKQGSEVIKSRVVPAVYADSSQRCWEHTDITGGCARCRQMKRSWAKLRPFNGTRIKEL
ncbi:hypothetical protein Purlil1_11854 [Purpureocillium lilacinum]|uniref:Uncharacterized protein n=1 Tax=Purpureocillium lilacinum TaxID=33203 RepID=A0ABR0BIG4_PURLI|nr:hypothetical protein Purlil1_11854 [Purpureocillium lilacinum]